MKALVWQAPRQMVLHTDWPEAVAGPGEVLVEVSHAGICGSELGGYLGHNALRVPPLVMGHEFAGTVVADSGRFRAGQAVTCNPMISCGGCVPCTEGLPHLCLTRALVGAHRPGAFASRVALPERSVVALPEGMSLRDGALVEPAAVAIRIGAAAGDVAGRVVLVIGAGPIGLLALQVLKGRGAARVFVSDRDPERLGMAAELGAETIDARGGDVVRTLREASGGLGAAVTVDAVGAAQTRRQGVQATRAAGTLLLSGLHEEEGAFPAAEAIRREITVRGVFCYTPADFRAALDAVHRGALRLDPWIVEAPLGEGGAWFDRLIAAPGGVAKVLLVP